jgi:hypothetical protein
MEPTGDPTAGSDSAPRRKRARRTPAENKTALLLAAIDMDQVIQAALMLVEEDAKPYSEQKHQRLRALETAIAVTYARPLIDSKGLKSYTVKQHQRLPADRPDLLPIHDHLLKVRKKTYAHTDKQEAMRTAEVNPFGYSETWMPWIEAKDAPAVIALAEYQQTRFRTIVGPSTKAVHPALAAAQELLPGGLSAVTGIG